MAKITIGGVEREGNLATFDKLEDAWPFIKEVDASRKGGADASANPMSMLRPMLNVVAVAIGSDLETVRRSLKVDEIANITPFFTEITLEMRKQATGEAEPAA